MRARTHRCLAPGSGKVLAAGSLLTPLRSSGCQHLPIDAPINPRYPCTSTGQSGAVPVHGPASGGYADAQPSLLHHSPQASPSAALPLPHQAPTPHPPFSSFQQGGASSYRLISCQEHASARRSIRPIMGDEKASDGEMGMGALTAIVLGNACAARREIQAVCGHDQKELV